MASEFFQKLKQNLEVVVSKHVYETLGYSGPVIIVKRNRKLEKGDIEVKLPKIDENDRKILQSSDYVGQIEKELCRQEELMIQRIYSEANSLFIHLNHMKISSIVIKQVLHSGEGYGKCGHGGHMYCVHCVIHPSECTMDQLRTLLLSEHLTLLLNANGSSTCQRYSMSTQDPSALEKWDRMTRLLNIRTGDLSPMLGEESLTKAFTYLSQCNWIHGEHLKNPITSLDAECDVTLDLRCYMTDNNMPVGKQGYDKNLHLLKINRDDQRLITALNIRDIHGLEKVNQFISVGSHRFEVSLQQTDILSKMISDQPMRKQGYLIHRGVKESSKEHQSIEGYYHWCSEQIEQAFKVKYGDDFDGSSWHDTIGLITQAAVRFNILSTSCSSIVKLSAGGVSSEGASGVSPGVFVMYNCARLAMLLSQYRQNVRKNMYGDIPDIDEIDFHTLRQQDEWVLVYNYMLLYPSIIMDCLGQTGLNQLHLQVATNKICQFVLDLTKDLSSYYSRTHILVECRKQLLPTMYARLILLTAVQQVLHNALGLLNIHPISHM